MCRTSLPRSHHSPEELPVDPQRVCDLLKSALAADPTATHALLCNRVPCNQAMLEHPTIIVDSLSKGNERPVVGLLGLLNALIIETGHVVAMCIDAETHQLVDFIVRKFEPAREPPGSVTQVPPG